MDDALRLRRISDDVVVCGRLLLGESFRQRFMGLMGRASMDADEGLYLSTSSIHMMFMRFPIDALFVSQAGEGGRRTVVSMREDLPAWRGIVMPVRGAEGVIELPAGSLARHAVAIGDEVVFELAGKEAAEPEVSAT
ncbi:MAG: DUF192 domain-containing protein [Chloroflexota bacterium]|nr:DUF192 domain-containing protein [Chloroflexota bacterium]